MSKKRKWRRGWDSNPRKGHRMLLHKWPQEELIDIVHQYLKK